jgi:HPt (histidine-containing phosphotransfer) domain-containing protein
MGQELKKYIDVDDALVRMCGNKKIYAMTLNMFLSSEELDKFDEALLKNDLSGAGGCIHTLKGVAGNLSLTELYNQSEPLIQKLKRGELDSALIENYRATHALTRGFVKEIIPQLGA